MVYSKLIKKGGATMLYGDRSRQELEEYAEKLFAKSEIIKDRASRRNLYDELMDHFGLEVSVVDEGSTNIVIYSEDNIYTIDTTDISWDEMEEKFVCGNKNCIVHISTEQY